MFSKVKNMFSKVECCPATSFNQFLASQDSASPARAEFTLAHDLPAGKPSGSRGWYGRDRGQTLVIMLV